MMHFGDQLVGNKVPKWAIHCSINFNANGSESWNEDRDNGFFCFSLQRKIKLSQKNKQRKEKIGSTWNKMAEISSQCSLGEKQRKYQGG